MAIRPYLAITGEEIAQIGKIPENAAWMFCPFSPDAMDVFDFVPAGKILVLTDADSSENTDPERIIQMLARLEPETLLLDFQRTENIDDAFAKRLKKALSCPVILPPDLAEKLDGPVFLPPVPLHTSLKNHIAPWKGRAIWLDISTEGEKITLTEAGASFETLLCFSPPEKGHQEERLHCHYSIALKEDAAIFTLWRTEEDIIDLLQESETFGIQKTIGLYQEWQGRNMLPFRREC